MSTIIKGIIKGKKKNILIFIALLLFNTVIILSRELNNLDELWNYNFARNISGGLLPYRDFNIIQMPLYPTIVALVLKICANEIIVSRIVAAILFSVILFLIYKILDFLIENKYIPIICLLCILFLYKDWFWGDYNYAVLLFTMLILYLELKNVNKNFFIGILAGMAIITKQSTGLFLAFTVVMYKFIFINNKIDLKNTIKVALICGLGVVIPTIFFLFYLLITNTFSDFYKYAISGISTFSNSISYFEMLQMNGLSIVYKAIMLIAPIIIIVSIVYYIKNRDKNVAILFCFSVQSMLIVYPLCDISHFLIGVLPTLVMSIYILSKWVNNTYIVRNCKLKLKISNLKLGCFNNINVVLYVIIAFLILQYVFYFSMAVKSYIQGEKCNFKHCTGICISSGVYNFSKIIIDYIESRNDIDVIILDTNAVLPMIALDRYHKNYDMLLKGNLGNSGEEGIIQNLQNENNKLYLVRNEPDTNRQSTEKIRQYIINNYKKIDSVGIYGVYEKFNE